MKKNVIILFLLFLFSLSVFALDGPDIRVQTVLNQLGYSYDIDSDYDYRLILDVGSGRTQLVFLNSSTNVSRGQEIREIWSMANKYADFIPQQAAQKVLLDSFDKIIGSWYAIETGESYIIAFCAKIPAESSSDYVNAAIQAIARGADSMEQVLTNGGDDY